MRPSYHHVGALLLLTLVACRERPAPDPMTLAVVELVPKVEGEAPLIITVGQYRAASARLRLQLEESLHAEALPEALSEHVLDELIRGRLVTREAERLGVKASTTAVAREMASLRATYPEQELAQRLANTYQTEADLVRVIEWRLLASALLYQDAFKGLEVDDAELQALWQDLKPAERTKAPRIHAAQIVLATEEEAEAVHRALSRGADFATTARALSIAPEGARGGDLGWFAQGDMPKVFDGMCDPLEIGALSAVTPSPFGFHICVVLGREALRELTFDEMKAQLRERKLADKRREAESKYLAELQARYEVQRHPERMKLEN